MVTSFVSPNKYMLLLYFDEEDPKRILLKLIFNTIDSRETKLKLSRNKIKPIKTAVNYIKISLFTMFFQLDKKICCQ
jgi:hypothetical protein